MLSYLDVSPWRPDLDNRQPLRWRKPRFVRVDHDMGDLFHAEVPSPCVDDILLIASMVPRHTFLILTDYPRRMREYFSDRDRKMPSDERAPLPNLWLGARVRDQGEAEDRLPYLTRIPAAIRFVSSEPLIGPLDLSPWLWTARSFVDPETGVEDTVMEGGIAIQWVIVGGESGPDARPMHPTWAHDLRIDCAQAGVKFFFTQWGDHVPAAGRLLPEVVAAEKVGLRLDATRLGLHDTIKADTAVLIRVGARAAGRMLDGREWNETPTVR